MSQEIGDCSGRCSLKCKFGVVFYILQRFVNKNIAYLKYNTTFTLPQFNFIIFSEFISMLQQWKHCCLTLRNTFFGITFVLYDRLNESALRFIIVAVSSITDAALEPAIFEGQHHPHSCEQLSSQFGIDSEGLQGEVFDKQNIRIWT